MTYFLKRHMRQHTEVAHKKSIRIGRTKEQKAEIVHNEERILRINVRRHKWRHRHDKH